MDSGSDVYENCMRIVRTLDGGTNLSSIPSCNKTLSTEDILLLYRYCGMLDSAVLEGRSKALEDRYNEPMLWIGIYIAIASLFCILAMAADLFYGFRHRKLWFPSKYFTLNSASIMVITIAMKLPVDLNNPMPGRVDQLTKVGSMTFMCIMMANLKPSLASMGDKELFANVTGLVILVVTMVVNVLIQIKTGVLNWSITIPIYVGTILYLLILLTSLALTTPVIESKYQVTHKKISNDRHPIRVRMFTVEELIQHVKRYWVMAGTCYPQFVMATTPLCTAAGILCVTSSILHFWLVVFSFMYEYCTDYRSAYKWSMLLIYITQSVGVAVGTIAPVFRCFAALNFKLSINHIKIFKVEKYWTQKLSDWKRIHLAFPFGGRWPKALVCNLKNLILNLCIGFEKEIVVSCKMIGFIPIGVVIFIMYCVYYWKSLKGRFFATFFTMSIASNRDTAHELEESNAMEDISDFVLQHEDEMELGIRTFKRISNSKNRLLQKAVSNSMKRLIQKAEKKLPNNLLELLEKSTGFDGVVNFDSDEVQPLLCLKLHNSWSLPVLSLTCIAIALPNICKDIVDSLFSSVGEGLLYTHLVEESLNNVDESKNIQRAAMALWHEVEVNYEWMGSTLQRNAYKGKTPSEILKWFVDKAKEIVVEINERTNEELLENSHDKLIVANSMYRIAQTLMFNYHNNIEQIREEQLFALLSVMIADILVACLTNLPRVIAMKCHERAIGKREARIQAAANLLARTGKIIEKLQGRELPSLDPDQLAFIDEWRVHLKQSIA